jgi:TfoX/Sxy family transcriptional regulator of competence genes
MPFDEEVAALVRHSLASTANVSERRMFGGLAFMVNGNMLCAVGNDHLMVRVGPAQYETALRQPHAHEMRFTGRPMRGYLSVDPNGYATRDAVAAWVSAALAFVSTLPPK